MNVGSDIFITVINEGATGSDNKVHTRESAIGGRRKVKDKGAARMGNLNIKISDIGLAFLEVLAKESDIRGVGIKNNLRHKQSLLSE